MSFQFIMMVLIILLYVTFTFVLFQGSEVLSLSGDYCSELAEGHDLDDLSMIDTLKRRKPLPSVFKHRYS